MGVPYIVLELLWLLPLRHFIHLRAEVLWQLYREQLVCLGSILEGVAMDYLNGISDLLLDSCYLVLLPCCV